jgi:hypothetical protein
MQTVRRVNTEASRPELPPPEAPEYRTVAPHIAPSPHVAPSLPPGGHTLRALEFGLKGHTKDSADTSIAERDFPADLVRKPPRAPGKPDEREREQTLRPGAPTLESTAVPRPEQGTGEEPARKQAPELRGVRRLDPPLLVDSQPAEPVRALPGPVPTPAASHPPLLGRRPAPPVEASVERTTSPQAITHPAPIGSASGVRAGVVGRDRPALPPLAKRIKQRAAGNLPEPATVHVTIGTLEVRANTMPSQPRAPSAPKPQAPRLGLEEYLQRRRERGHG